ncbi:MAG: peptidylprolyl isomerase [Desulfosarcina sp.]|jgi:peptidyl-prolyl cis-trans isomerase SurA
MKRKLSLGVQIGMVMLVFAVTATASAASELIDRIVAVVNEDIILLSELNERLRPYAQRIRQQGFSQEETRKMLFKVREEMINRLVDEKLTDQEIERYAIQVDASEIDNTIERMKKVNYLTDEDLRQFLEKEAMTMEQYRSQIEDQILRTRLVNFQVKSKIVITEEEIQAYYDTHPELYGGTIIYQLRTILMRVPDFSSEAERAAVLAKMQEMRSRVAAGDSFSDLASMFSQSPTATDGGNLGEFSKETLSPQIQAALDGLKKGQTTDVLDTDLGFQLFYIEAINRSQGKPLDSVKGEIQQKLFEEVVDRKFSAWLEELRRQSHIKIIN